jgi:nitroimidazol reductase NimA-like FMN-containing flavoprotein (pyridoxamine 5'-phosphate oxidase superfamily)
MRRQELEIKDRKIIDEIIKKSRVCRLGLSYNDIPYVIPLCFGYDKRQLFFHSYNIGEKIDIIKKNNKVCFEFDIDCEPIPSENACDWQMKYKSVIGFGKASLVTNIGEKIEALNIIMQQYTNQSKFQYSDSSLNKIAIIRVDIESITGKISE